MFDLTCIGSKDNLLNWDMSDYTEGRSHLTEPPQIQAKGFTKGMEALVGK